MKEYVLSYYPQFKCIADKCKHTCCAGWEMNIDKTTLNDYKNDTSKFCNTLKNGINFKKSKFKTDKSKRCAFLNDNGLCDIIINIGEESLCQVCRDHPRFRSFFDDSVEMGLGFCCEQATKIILSYNDKITPILIADDTNCCTQSFIQQHVLKFRQQALDIIQDRSEDINERIIKLLALCNAKVYERDFKKILRAFISLEKLDKSWGRKLSNLKKTPFTTKNNDNLSLYCEQFLANSLFRHLSNAEDTMWVRARAIACVFAWWIIKSVIESQFKNKFCFDDVCETVRTFSAETEYSQKNLDKLFAFAYKFINI